MTREEFFEKLKTGAKWDVGVAINRTNPVPLDANEIFESIATMEAYIKSNALAYPGQIVVVLGETETAAYLVNAVGGEGKGYSKLAATTGSGDVGEELTKLAARVAVVEGYFTEGGIAKKATADAAGNVIADTYATVTALGGVQTTAEKGVSDAAAAKAAADAAKEAADAKVGAVSLASGVENGTVKLTVDGVGTEVAVTGLGSAAYTAADAYDTAGKAQELVGAHNVSTEAHSDIRQSITALAEKVSGRATSYVYKNKSDAAYTTAIGKAGSFVVGDTIYFTDTNILDEWVTKVNAAAPYYEFQEIETEKPSFDGYVKGTGLTADKLVLGNAGSNVKASTYGVSGVLTASDDANLPTSKAIADYLTEQISAKQDNLNTDQLAAVNSGITADKVGIYDGYATGKQDKIDADHKLSADLVSGLGAAAKKDVDATVLATSENLPTSKAVASYVGTEIGKIDIPTVNNAALKDASGATIFTANASADVEITVIDCGNANGWGA